MSLISVINYNGNATYILISVLNFMYAIIATPKIC